MKSEICPTRYNTLVTLTVNSLRIYKQVTLLCLLLAGCYATSAQDRWFFQCVSGDIVSQQDALHADSLLRLNEGVIVSRSDFNTHNILVICSSEELCDQVPAMLSDLGLSIACVHRGKMGVDRIEPLDPRMCNDHPVAPKED
ncbi:MAG: hypothetical protein KDC12_01940 [Flavobacteriales bacterium]|nr:hypothetical protein [Flavobacteriales bacterium]